MPLPLSVLKAKPFQNQTKDLPLSDGRGGGGGGYIFAWHISRSVQFKVKVDWEDHHSLNRTTHYVADVASVNRGQLDDCDYDVRRTYAPICSNNRTRSDELTQRLSQWSLLNRKNIFLI
ncbi:hypothetical protein TYRP_006923 [Tyrophagus putrescentiae]|nr:hypothetical protein TYRP_006923 [Tyrophagus putrescentiae]